MFRTSEMGEPTQEQIDWYTTQINRLSSMTDEIMHTYDDIELHNDTTSPITERNANTIAYRTMKEWFSQLRLSKDRWETIQLYRDYKLFSYQKN